MNKPVSFKLAKLLAINNIDIPSYDAYNTHGMQFSNGWLEYIDDNEVNIPFTKADLKPLDILAPTIADVIMWIYGNYSIWLEIWHDHLKDEFYTILNGEELIHKTPKEAYEEAIIHWLTVKLKIN